MSKYIIFTDVDGTVYPRDKKIHPKTLKGLKLAREKGVEIVISTGNAFLLNENMHNLAKQIGVRYILSSNGATIYDCKESKLIFQETISEELAFKISQYGCENKISMYWWNDKHLFRNKFAAEVDPSNVAGEAMLKDKDTIITQKTSDSEIYKIEVYDTPANVEQFMEHVKDYGLQMARMKPNHVEITRLGVSKGHAIERFIKLLDIPLENTMGIGDSANDITMLKIVGYSYAMGNAPVDIKQFAKYHTSSVEQGGLGEAIEDFLYRIKI